MVPPRVTLLPRVVQGVASWKGRPGNQRTEGPWGRAGQGQAALAPPTPTRRLAPLPLLLPAAPIRSEGLSVRMEMTSSTCAAAVAPSECG